MAAAGWRVPAVIFGLVTALLGVAGPAGAQAREKCYGVAPAGKNDGIDGKEAPGSSKLDYQGNAWIWVAQGRCVTMAPPVAPDGTPRRGALQPLDRDRS